MSRLISRTRLDSDLVAHYLPIDPNLRCPDFFHLQTRLPASSGFAWGPQVRDITSYFVPGRRSVLGGSEGDVTDKCVLASTSSCRISINAATQSLLNSQPIPWQRHCLFFREARGVGGFRPCPFAAFGLPEVCTCNFPFHGDGSETSSPTRVVGVCDTYDVNSGCALPLRSGHCPARYLFKKTIKSTRYISPVLFCFRAWAGSRLVEMQIMKRCVVGGRWRWKR